ncbi:MAG: hypothetical protein M3290_04350 [Actinomycetota bacterium]|nr:hypothetical protein [Actinomycetota bacterium]
MPVAVTATSDDTFWVLGTSLCPTISCLRVLRTVDGGKNWTVVGRPGAALSLTRRGSGISSIRFADADDGFAFAPDLWATHDRGRSWVADAIPGAVRTLEAAAGSVFAVVSTGGSDQLFRAHVSDGSWARVALPHSAAPAYTSLALHGSDVWIVGGGRSSQRWLFVSHDSGGTFQTLHAPCVAHLGTALAPVDSQVVWALCVGGMQSYLERSTDGGRDFDQLPPTPAIPNSSVFGAIGSDTVAVGPGCEDLLMIDAHGRAKKAIRGKCNGAAMQWAFVGFTDESHAFALRYEFESDPPRGELWRTADGGATWSRLEF